MGEKPLESYGPAMAEPVSKGIKFRFLLSDGLLPNHNSVPGEVCTSKGELSLTSLA